MTNTKTAKPSQSEITIANIKAAQAKLDRAYPATLRVMGEDTDDLRDFNAASEALSRIIARMGTA